MKPNLIGDYVRKVVAEKESLVARFIDQHKCKVDDVCLIEVQGVDRTACFPELKINEIKFLQADQLALENDRLKRENCLFRSRLEYAIREGVDTSTDGGMEFITDTLKQADEIAKEK